MIPEYKKILFATDLSASAAVVLRHVVGVARAHQASVELVHVVPDPDQAVINYVATIMGEGKLGHIEKEHREEIAAELSKKLKDFAHEELADHPEDLERIDRIEVLHGHPAPVILSEARRIGADLIVIGTHGKGRLEYTFLGSVAQRIARKTDIPLLLIPLTH
ncbi:MAG: universal stress protein [Deltaproteobacteria bacterium]|nr:MAG: universal stress protein [Deltaproteobacteria bacterium]